MSAPPEDDRALRRRKLVGRVVIAVFGLLLLAYLVADVTYRMQMK